jgi:hypothetical protein
MLATRSRDYRLSGIRASLVSTGLFRELLAAGNARTERAIDRPAGQPKDFRPCVCVLVREASVSGPGKLHRSARLSDVPAA